MHTSSLQSCCAITIGLSAIALIIVLSLIPVYLKDNRSPSYGSMPFSVNYKLSNGTLPLGSVSDSHRNLLYSQLSSIVIDTVEISITSAELVDQNQGKRSLVRRQTAFSQVLQLTGVVHARQGCLRKCLVDFVKRFKSNLCTMPLVLPL